MKEAIISLSVICSLPLAYGNEKRLKDSERKAKARELFPTTFVVSHSLKMRLKTMDEVEKKTQTT